MLVGAVLALPASVRGARWLGVRGVAGRLWRPDRGLYLGRARGAKAPRPGGAEVNLTAAAFALGVEDEALSPGCDLLNGFVVADDALAVGEVVAHPYLDGRGRCACA